MRRAYLRKACRSVALVIESSGRDLAELLGERINGLQGQQKATRLRKLRGT